MADWPPDVGDLVRVKADSLPPRTGIATTPQGPALVLEKDAAGWLRVKWLTVPESHDGFDRWFPPAKLVVISRGYEKDEESFKKNT